MSLRSDYRGLHPDSSAGRGGRWAALVACAATLLACLPTMLTGLAGRDSTHTMENVALVTSQETWLRCHEGEPGAWLMTTNDGQPRVEKPPLLTWLNFAAWADLDPSGAQPPQLVYRARLVSLMMGLVLLGAVFWTGAVLGGLRLAAIAALAGGSILLFQRQARVASYDIHYVAWLSLAVASAVWAMKPLGEPPGRGRQVAGWLGSGVALSASVMSKNPLPVALFVLLVGGAIVLSPGRRRPSVVGLLCAVLVVVAVVGPWYGHALLDYEDAFRTLRNEFRQPRRAKDAPQAYYYVCVFGLVAPWTLWLISGLIHPFAAASRRHRRGAMLPLLWFAVIFVFFSIPAAKQQRYILPIIPAAALLIARVWRDHEAMAQRGERDRSAKVVIWAHWITLLVASLGFAPFLAMQEPLIARFVAWREHLYASMLAEGRTSGFVWEWIAGDDLPTEAVVGSIGWPSAVLITLLLTGLGIWGLLSHLRWRPMRAFVISAAWALVFLAVYWHCYAAAPSARHPIRGTAEALAARVGDAPLRSLRITEHDRTKYKLNEEFRFYFGRRIRHVTPETLEAYVHEAGRVAYVLAKDGQRYTAAMRDADFRDMGLVQVDKDEQQRLWARGP